MQSRPTAIPECRIRETGFGLEDVRAFQRAGALILRDLIDPAELAVLQESASSIIDWSWQAGRHADVAWSDDPDKPGAIPVRIEYPVDKGRPIFELAGHPLLLRVMEAVVGPNLIPTWDSMVFKLEQGSPGIVWHRDGQMYPNAIAVTGPGRVVDVGIYLDPASPDNGVWALPGSNYWADDKAAATLDELNSGGWQTGDALPTRLNPGDALMHNILTLHGAPPARGSRRRVIYFEYRPAEVEYYLGPHTREYIGLKQKTLLDAIEARRSSEVGTGEEPFAYNPADAMRLWDDTPLTTLRYPHRDYWSWNGGKKPE